MTNTKPLAGISLDLDNKWSYMKTHGDKNWEDYPTYLDIFIPHVLDILDQLQLKITFFVVGQDAALKKNEEYLRLLIERGHEVGNHSFSHEPWLQRYSKAQITDEVMGAEHEITRVTGQKPLGFRGPGFTWSQSLFEVLTENGYIYDASTLPTYIGPLARAYYFWRTDFDGNERKQRDELFGGIRDGFRSVKPYLWEVGSGRTLLEIPVTTIPIIKTPFHLSYLIYLSQFSVTLMLTYLKTAIAFCKTTSSGISFLLHPLDFIDVKQMPELAFFPGMNIEKERKIQLFVMVVDILARHYNLENMSSYARSLLIKNGRSVDNQ